MKIRIEISSMQESRKMAPIYTMENSNVSYCVGPFMKINATVTWFDPETSRTEKEITGSFKFKFNRKEIALCTIDYYKQRIYDTINNEGCELVEHK